jgi:hypothetical protein
MVKIRGISVSMILQHEIRKVPEYDPPTLDDPFRIDGPTLRSVDESIASCYVPILNGSQIWFDYSIDTPHPPNAQYFFKLLRNGELLTSWDCTAKHDYQGRTTHGLKYIGVHPHTGQSIVRRQDFIFSTQETGLVGPFDNCVEVRVHRIDHRARVTLDSMPQSHEALAQENTNLSGLW